MRKGSFTIEMACLMPLFLLVIMGSISLCFYVHNRAWLTAAAHESALMGSYEILKSNGQPKEAAEMRGRQLLAQKLFGAKDLQMQVDAGTKNVQVGFDENTASAYGGLSWHLQVEASEKSIDPVSFIWKIKGLEQITNTVRGNE